MKADPNDTYCPGCEDKYCGCGGLKEDPSDRLSPGCQDAEDEARPDDDDGPDDDGEQRPISPPPAIAGLDKSQAVKAIRQ
jgi:hypothetical protein